MRRRNYEQQYRALWRNVGAREERFSARVLTGYVAARLPETLAVLAQGDAPAEILLYDEIGYWGVTAKDFVLALAEAGDGPLTVRINSPGGDVFDGMAIYNALKARTAPVTVVVDGIAASAASYIAMAGKTVTMGEASMMMIHNAQGICFGDRHDMTDMIGIMEKIDTTIAGIYAAKTGKAAADCTGLMDAETWMTSSEAKDAGFCDAVTTAPGGEGGNPEQQPENKAARFRAQALKAARLRAAYDPDGDGDDDAAEAIGLMATAQSLLGQAINALNGTENAADDDNDDAPIVPGARQRRSLTAAATSAEWMCGAANDLPINTDKTWDGPAAAERILDDAGFNGASPDPAKAKLGFLAWDHHNPKLKGSYKLPFADLIDGKLTALKSGIDAAASRLPDSDIPAEVQTKARAALEGYEKRMKPADEKDTQATAARSRNLRLAEAEAA